MYNNDFMCLAFSKETINGVAIIIIKVDDLNISETFKDLSKAVDYLSNLW